MIRVVSVIGDLHFGGGENRLLNIARASDRGRFDVQVLTVYQGDAPLDAAFGSMASDFARAGIKISNLGVKRSGSSRHRARQMAGTLNTLRTAVTRLRAYIVDNSIDLVDGHLDSGALIGGWAARLARVPAAVTLYQTNPFKRHTLWKQLYRSVLRSSRAVITDSKPRAAELTAFAKLPPSRVHVIPNGVCLRAPERNRAEMLAHWRLPPDAIVVGQVSSLVPFKGHRVLLDAAPTFLRSHPRTFLVCTGFPRGDTSYAEMLPVKARCLGIAERVRFSGYAGNIADVWNAVDIHVHASLFDSLPNAIIEGMSLGKPAVVTNVGGIPDLVIDGESALVVRAGDAAALASAIGRLLDDGDFAARLGAAAFGRYQRLFTPEITTRQVENCWAECVAVTAGKDNRSLAKVAGA